MRSHWKAISVACCLAGGSVGLIWHNGPTRHVEARNTTHGQACSNENLPEDSAGPAVEADCHDVATGVEGEARVGKLGDPARLVVKGTTTFKPEQVRAAVLADFSVVMWSHPDAPLAGYVGTLAMKLEEGFRNMGFPHAKVQVEHEGNFGFVVATVDEGKRYLAGDVRVRGTQLVAPEQLLEGLLKPFPPPNAAPVFVEVAGRLGIGEWVDANGNEVELKQLVWERGKPAPFSAMANEVMTRRVTEVLANLGHPFAEVSVTAEPHPDGETASLVVRVVNEGPSAIFREIAIEGISLGKNSRDDILAAAGITPGLLLTTPARAAIQQRLWQSGRFTRHELATKRAPDGDGVDVVLQLTEYPHAPPLAMPFSREEEALLKFRGWLAAFERRGGELRMTMRDVKERTEYELNFLPGTGAVLRQRSIDQPAAPFSHALVLTNEMLGCFSASHRWKWTTSPPRGRQIRVYSGCKLLENYEDGKLFNYSFGAEVVHGSHHIDRPGPLFLDLMFSPVAFLAVPHEVTPCEWRGDELTVTSDTNRLRIDSRDGRLIEFAFDGGNGGGISFGPGRDGFDRALREVERLAQDWPNGFDPQRPVSSTVSTLLADDVLELLTKLTTTASLAAEKPATKTGCEWTDLRRLRPLVQLGLFAAADKSFVRWWEEGYGARDEGDNDRFCLPSQDPTPGGEAAEWMRNSAVLANELFPHGSWPWRLWYASVCLSEGKDQNAAVEFQKLGLSPKSGPLCHLTVAQWADWIHWGRLRHMFAKQGQKRLSATNFENDLPDLLDERVLLGRSALRTAENIRDLPDREVATLGKELLIGGPRSSAFNAFVAHLRQHQDQPLAEILPAAARILWESGLRAEVEQALAHLTNKPVEP